MSLTALINDIPFFHRTLPDRARFVSRRNFTVAEGTLASLSALVEANPEVHSFNWIRDGLGHIGPISTRQPVTFLQSDMRFSAGVRNIMGGGG